MKWNQKGLLKAGKQIAKAVGARDFEGETGDEFVKWLGEITADRNVTYEGLMEDSEFDADTVRKGWKAVHITPDAGEEIIVNDGMETAEADVEDEETKELDEDEELTKAFRLIRKHQQDNGIKPKTFMKSVHESSLDMPGHKRFGDARSAKMLAYDRRVKSGERMSKTGHAPVFADAERMEAFNALVRYQSMGNHGYKFMKQDEKILTKTHVLSQNSTGGAVVFGEFFPDLIENFSSYGAARAAAGITPMSEGRWVGPKLHSDITVGDVGEGEAMTASDVLLGNVELNASKSYALAKVSMELLNDAAVNLEDVLASSMMRALRAYEDDCYFNSANNRQGISSKIGSNSTNDANLAGRSTANWGGYEVADIQNTIGKLATWASEDPNFGIACSWQYYMTVLRRFMQSAGGNTGAMLASGVAGPGLTSRWEWDGIPVYINNKAPKTYNADQIDAYIGAFSYATKLGVVTGSESIATTDQRWFDEDIFGIKMTQRWAINVHDVNDEALSASTDAGSGVVALKA